MASWRVGQIFTKVGKRVVFPYKKSFVQILSFRNVNKKQKNEIVTSWPFPSKNDHFYEKKIKIGQNSLTKNLVTGKTEILKIDIFFTFFGDFLKNVF